MKVLLMSMPDAASAFDNIATMPSAGLCSLAGNLRDCEIRILDLIAYRRHVSQTILSQIYSFRPNVVGLSAMTFQYSSAVKVAKIIREWNPEVPIVLGGYHGSLCYKEVGLSAEATLFDFLIRGEGEMAFEQLISALRKGNRDFSAIPGLSYKKNGEFVHNPKGPLADLKKLKRPNRQARVVKDFTLFGLPFDCLETSRGCVLNCRFCSITKMYGRNFRKFPLEMILSQIDELQLAGRKWIFLVDDNITLDVRWLRTLCEAIISEGFNNIRFVIQASVDGIYSDLTLPKLLYQAGFRIVFLGIESGKQRNLDLLRKGYSVNQAKAVVSELHDHGIATIGGFIVGNPDDRLKDIRDAFRFAREVGVDHAMMLCLTPYPKTEIRELLEAEALITNLDKFEFYNGFIANVKTRHMDSLQIARQMVKAGIPYYMDPRHMSKSLLWRYSDLAVVHLFLNNLKFIYSGWRNRMFHSTHRF
jgi:anaerobic magnesium-protoporphyrin IX monomethyl ester cyclase